MEKHTTVYDGKIKGEMGNGEWGGRESFFLAPPLIRAHKESCSESGWKIREQLEIGEQFRVGRSLGTGRGQARAALTRHRTSLIRETGGAA